MSQQLIKKYESQKQDLSEPTQTSPLNKYEFRLSIHIFPIHTMKEVCAKVFKDLKE